MGNIERDKMDFLGIRDVDTEKMKIIWTERIRNEEVLRRVREEMDQISEITKTQANWLGHEIRGTRILPRHRKDMCWE